MTRGARTVLFILAATIANMVATAVVFILLIVVYGLTLGRLLPVASSGPVILVAFLAAVVVSAIAYKKALDWARKRWNLEQRLGFGPRKSGGGDSEGAAK